jgi:hypothetical protein
MSTSKDFMRWTNYLAPFIAVAGLSVTFAFTPADDQLVDQLAWQTLAQVSSPTQSTGSWPADTPFSWRLWWTSKEIYPETPTSTPPYLTDTRGKFVRLQCLPESEQMVFGEQPASPCEVVLLNGASAGYILANRLWIRENLVAKAATNSVSFPQAPDPPAIEMKTEWRAITDDQRARYVVGLDSQLVTRGLVAFHMMIRARPNWVWATYIHEDFAGLVGQAGASLNDLFGSPNGQPSVALLQLLKANQADVLQHYKLIGTQTDFGTLLGNPLIEPSALIQQHKVSCISCHSQAAVGIVKNVNYGQIAPIAKVLVNGPGVPKGFGSTNFNFTISEDSSCRNESICSTAQPPTFDKVRRHDRSK